LALAWVGWQALGSPASETTQGYMTQHLRCI